MEYLYIIIIFFPFLLLFSVYKRDIFLYDRNSIFVSQKKKKKKHSCLHPTNNEL
jgi:hypothetical protein